VAPLDERAGRPLRRKLVHLAQAFAAWTAIAVIYWARRPLYALSTGSAFPPWRDLVEPVLSCWVWAAFTPPMLWLAARFPLDRASWRRSAPVHLLAAVASVALSAAIAHGAFPLAGVRAAPSYLAEVAGEQFIDLFSYAAVAALGHALAYHRLSTEQRLRASGLEAKLLAARLEALEARLHPHFLFNALNTISSLVRTGEPQAAVRAVARLGDLFRALLREDGGQEVPLSQELDFVSRYLELERARFGDRLETRVEAEPEVLEALVPRLVLQPLVENALRHGIEPSARPGRVEVHAARSGGMLRLEVHDTGAGGARAAPSTRVGLTHTRARLTQLYGDCHELELVAEGGGTVARVCIPLHRAARSTVA
jgi:two-component system LytT family sensor kinase